MARDKSDEDSGWLGLRVARTQVTRTQSDEGFNLLFYMVQLEWKVPILTTFYDLPV